MRFGWGQGGAAKPAILWRWWRMKESSLREGSGACPDFDEILMGAVAQSSLRIGYDSDILVS
jgi:hypothetical protein